MNRTLIGSAQNSPDDRTIMLQGFVETIRNHKNMIFFILRDRTGKCQVAIHKPSLPELAATCEGLTRESSITVTGTRQNNAQVKLGGFEIVPETITVLNRAQAMLPIDITADPPSLEVRMDHRDLDLRRPENLLLMQVQTSAEMAMRAFWGLNGFIEIHTPKLMGTASESGAELFSLEYFGRTAYLAQSPQFYKQMAMAAGLDRIFEIGPVFRANPSMTSRHDTEFTSVDVEVSWVNSHHDVMDIEEEWLKYVLAQLKHKHSDEIREVFGQEVVFPIKPFPRISMAEAHEYLKSAGHVFEDPTKQDLDPAGERLIGQMAQDRYDSEFVFIVDYPVDVRPFYHMRDEATGLTKSFDLLWKGLEVTTGAQREHRPDILFQQAKEKGLSREGLQFYLNFFESGCPPHGGYGFGLTRMLMVLLGVKNVREVTFLYRGMNRLHP